MGEWRKATEKRKFQVAVETSWLAVCGGRTVYTTYTRWHKSINILIFITTITKYHYLAVTWHNVRLFALELEACASAHAHCAFRKLQFVFDLILWMSWRFWANQKKKNYSHPSSSLSLSLRASPFHSIIQFNSAFSCLMVLTYTRTCDTEWRFILTGPSWIVC